jgi:hypothetical protein
LGGLLASTGKPERKQNPLSPTRLRGRNQQPGGRHEASPQQEKLQIRRDFFFGERGSGFLERESLIFFNEHLMARKLKGSIYLFIYCNN